MRCSRAVAAGPPTGQNGLMTNKERDAMSDNKLAAIAFGSILGLSVAFGVFMCLILLATREAPVLVWIGVAVWLVVSSSVSLGRFIARWREKRAKVPDGPEADYVDPPATQP
jgi:hypothetical protein